MNEYGVTANEAEAISTLVKLAYIGTFHWFRFKRLERYVDEFQYLLNVGSGNGFQVIGQVVEDWEGKRLTWRGLMTKTPEAEAGGPRFES